ncbi:hypothetical protein [Algicola sagamiensis]|uniref:hypothetical protein n=1 Tax=Algicola sagamiensis TaxID=163869 RepID=UPI00037F3705|nr:hypothetical protein [Algicola sagamiensis]
MTLNDMIEQLPQFPPDYSFGEDIDQAHQSLFSIPYPEGVEESLRAWASRFQPCVFGKLASKQLKKLDYHLTIVDVKQLEGDVFQLFEYLQKERRCFKDRALKGEVSAHLIYFIHEKLAFAKPSSALVSIQQQFAALIYPEALPIQCDMIYTEAVPLLHQSGQFHVYKGGINVFYTGAHLTHNHDRRVPGGILFSVNAPGHYLQCGLMKGLFKEIYDGLMMIKKLSIQSIGAGGTAHPKKHSTTWHSETPKDRFGCPFHGNVQQSAYYSGYYHTDVLIPSQITKHAKVLLTKNVQDPIQFDWNVLFYISLEEFTPDHVYYGEFIGMPIEEEALYHNPFFPRRPNEGPLETMKEEKSCHS